MTEEQHELTFADYLALLKRRKWGIIVPFCLVFLIATAVALFLAPIYRSVSTILIEEQEIPADFVMTTVTSYAEQRLQVINQRIMSSSRLLEIINRFNLYSDLANKWTTEEIVEKMRDDVKLDFINADIVDRRTGRPTAATIAFTLSYEGEAQPQTVQSVANVLASLFLEENLKVRQKQVSETSEFFKQEYEKIKLDLDAQNSRIATFKEKHVNELPELLQVNMQSLNNNEVNSERFSEQIRALRERANYLETQLASTAQEIPSTRITADETTLENLKVDLVHLKARYSDSYPDVIKTKAEIKKLEERLASGERVVSRAEQEQPDNPAFVTISSQLASVKSELQSTINQKKEYEEKADMFRRRISATPEVEREYQQLLNERDTNQAKLDDLGRKLLESRVAEGLETDQKGERFTIIDPARLPEKPYKPNRLAIMLIGLVLGIGAGVGYAAIAEFSDRAVYSSNDLYLATLLPVLAIIPELTTAREIAAQVRKKKLLIVGALISVVALVILFHVFVMDINVFFAKLQRRLAL